MPGQSTNDVVKPVRGRLLDGGVQTFALRRPNSKDAEMHIEWGVLQGSLSYKMFESVCNRPIELARLRVTSNLYQPLTQHTTTT
eukprot:6059215-Pyramimonas_sp.AAC.1